MPDLRSAASWFRDTPQRRRTQDVIWERFADMHHPEECRYLQRLCWQLATRYHEVSYEALVAHVRPEKLAYLKALFDAGARGHSEIDAWIARCEAALPILEDRVPATDATPPPPPLVTR